MSESAHSPIGASSMHRWAACPGSVRESRGKPNSQSWYAEEGTEAHAMGAAWLRGENFPQPATEEGWEMLSAVQEYVEYVNSRREPGDVIFIEHRFDISAIHTGCYGIADCVIWNPVKKHLIVIDYKHGAGLFINVIGNRQLKYYALGALVTCNFPVQTVEMVIVQPRIPTSDGVIRSQTINAIDLFDFAVDVNDFATATEQPDAPLISGEHCRFCPAAASCPELLKTTQLAVATEFRNDLSYDPQKLKLALDSRPAIQAWLKAVDEFAYNEAEAGRCPPGYKLVDKRPTRRWRDEQKVIDTLEAVDFEIYAPPKLMSVAQMEKKVNKQMLESLWDSKSSGHALVSEADNRPAVKPSAEEEFKDV